VKTQTQQAEILSPQPFTKGLIEIFTGNGKGKTSAALGVVLRALGHGLRVCIIYFMKGDYPYGEQSILSQLPGVSFFRFGQMSFVDPQNIKEEERQQADEALKVAREAMLSGKYDVVVLDEVNIAAAWGLVGVGEVVNLIREKPEGVELILTGRYADSKLIELADVVTEMVEIKHPYRRGMLSRAGIDY
jgi:cob(I)alamin adenosyltransferase